MAEERQIFSLSQVTASIRKIISERYQSLYWVKAEMHKLNYTNKGHCYPELVQKEGGKIVAEMRGTIWKDQFERISRNFTEVIKEPLRDGLSLLFQVRISFHPLYGMGLEIVDIDPAYTLGELHKEREESLKRLHQEGILNANQLLPIALLPQRIAVISVESSKGLSDFYSVIKDNRWGYHFFTMLFQAQLNGDAAIESIQKQLDKIRRVTAHFDVVAIIRGGGGEIGLSCFNNFELAKAIATFPLPVLTGIGHSTNITVSEMVAYKNAITPTELGEFLLQAFHNFSVPVQEAAGILQTESRRFLIHQKQLISNEARLFRNVSQRMIIQNRLLVREENRSLVQKATFRFKTENESIFYLKDRFRAGVKNRVASERREIELNLKSIDRGVHQHITKTGKQLSEKVILIMKVLPGLFAAQAEKLNLIQIKTDLLNPENLIKRGYSLTLHKGKLITESNHPFSGEEIKTITKDYILVSRVEQINKRKDE